MWNPDFCSCWSKIGFREPNILTPPPSFLFIHQFVLDEFYSPQSHWTGEGQAWNLILIPLETSFQIYNDRSKQLNPEGNVSTLRKSEMICSPNISWHFVWQCSLLPQRILLVFHGPIQMPFLLRSLPWFPLGRISGSFFVLPVYYSLYNNYTYPTTS